MTDELQPWDQQDNESAAAFNAFVRYRDSDPQRRTVQGVADQLDVPRGTVWGWSAKFHWRERLRAYEKHRDDMWQEALGERQREAADRHARIAHVALVKVSQRLVDLDANTLTEGGLARLFEAAVKVERDSLGMAHRTEITGKDGGPMQVEVGPMSLHERREWLQRARAEVNRRLDVIEGGGGGNEEEQGTVAEAG